MKKEILLSIIIGLCLGLLITFGLYSAKKAIKIQKEILSPQVESEINRNQQPANTFQTLSLISPLDQSISSEPKTTLSGTSSPLSWVIILTEKGEAVIRADEKGGFETEVQLISGENEIQIKAITDRGEESEKIITVVYSTAEI